MEQDILTEGSACERKAAAGLDGCSRQQGKAEVVVPVAALLIAVETRSIEEGMLDQEVVGTVDAGVTEVHVERPRAQVYPHAVRRLREPVLVTIDGAVAR
jgi:hypothetical protein